MADHDSHYVHGSMDISQHKRGYAAFLTGVRWTLGFILLIMIFLAFFRTHNGLPPT
jgi:preprotein translocase subunit SecG